MMAYHYSCDCGSLAVGSGACRVLVHNSVGDGRFRLLVFDSREEAGMDGSRMPGWTFETVCEGDGIEVFDYDCTYPEAECEARVLCTLSGRYGIYRKDGSGDMALVRGS